MIPGAPPTRATGRLNIGITGQPGFIGTHLYNTLGLADREFERVLFRDDYFDRQPSLEDFVRRCDVVVHLAAVNRHSDPGVLYDTNIQLTQSLVRALEATTSRPHVVHASSIQEARDNPYGRSKKRSREMLAAWAERNGARFTGLIIPNVFGPFGRPFANSVVATFSHQLTHGETPAIDLDQDVGLIYVQELVDEILDAIRKGTVGPEIRVPATARLKVSHILETLRRFKTDYLDTGIIPSLRDAVERNLFNTFRGYADIRALFPVRLDLKSDDRGDFAESVKARVGGQVSYSTTRPGATRGNHFHLRKIERFAVIRGEAIIRLRRIGTDEVFEFPVSGARPVFVDMPIWHTHNLTNTGRDDLVTLFWSSEIYDPDDPDTYFENV